MWERESQGLLADGEENSTERDRSSVASSLNRWQVLQRMRSLRHALISIALLVAGSATTTLACVGPNCIELWSAADGGGALTIFNDFNKKVQTYESFCTADRSTCLFSTIDPGFMA